MKLLWLRALIVPAVALFIGLILWPLLGISWAIGALALGLAWSLAGQLKNMRALLGWLRDPTRNAVPLGSGGAWEQAFSALYRLVRRSQQHQHRLSGQLARFRSAAQAMPDGVMVLGAENHIVWCNATAERWFDLDAKKDVGQVIFNLVRNPELADYLQRESYAEPLMLRIARGDGLVLSLRVVPYGQDERLLLSRDVTQAEKLEIMRRDFVANVSHELKTPLTVVSGFLETIVDGTVQVNDARGHHVLELMHNQTDRMLRLIEDLLTLSVLESRSAPTRETWIDVHQLLRALHEQVCALSAERHTIVLDAGPAATLFGDEQEINSALSNLLSNAVRYTPTGGAIALRFALCDGEGRFSIEDSGVGIEAEHISRLTERFYRADTGRSRETGGTGLGLAIVKHVLTLHQARLEIQSEFGRGSVFSAIFPRRRVQTQVAHTVWIEGSAR